MAASGGALPQQPEGQEAAPIALPVIQGQEEEGRQPPEASAENGAPADQRPPAEAPPDSRGVLSQIQEPPPSDIGDGEKKHYRQEAEKIAK